MLPTIKLNSDFEYNLYITKKEIKMNAICLHNGKLYYDMYMKLHLRYNDNEFTLDYTSENSLGDVQYMVLDKDYLYYLQEELPELSNIIDFLELPPLLDSEIVEYYKDWHLIDNEAIINGRHIVTYII